MPKNIQSQIFEKRLFLNLVHANRQKLIVWNDERMTKTILTHRNDNPTQLWQHTRMTYSQEKYTLISLQRLDIFMHIRVVR